MKTLITLLVLVVMPSLIFSQEYSIASIPASLSEGMDAVTHHHSGTFEVLASDKAKYTEKRAITIFNKDGGHNAFISVWFDKLRSISGLEAAVYDANGGRIERIRKSSFNEESATGDNFFDDSRVLWYDLRQDDFPYTVEYEYEVTYNYLYSIPDWSFIDAFAESVMYSSYEIISPEELKPRFQTLNANEPVESTSNGIYSVKWEEKNLSGIDFELYGPSLKDIAPRVIASPSVFEFEGYRGDLSTWDGVALWQNILNKDRDELPSETIQKINNITEGMSEREKIRAIYEYVQSNTRYVSIQLGIGGFQPFPAKVVDEEGYGDCKALSFYTQSLLKAVGIPSHYTWVYGGNNPPAVSKEFPDDTFNHIILCVPQEQDTIWLECTNQTNPFGYLGSFTGNRDVLVVTEEGGKIVRTPSYTADDNVQTSVINVQISDEGNADVQLKNAYKGVKYEYQGLSSYLNLGEDKQKEWLEYVIDIPSFNVGDFTFTNKKDLIPVAEIESDLFVNKLVSKSGTRFFLQPNLMNKNTFIPNKDDNREQKIYTGYAYTEIDSIYYTLPENHSVEAYFSPIEIRSVFGQYNATIEKLEDGRILYCRKFRKENGVFDPEQYDEYMNFHKRVVRADKKRISLKKKT